MLLMFCVHCSAEIFRCHHSGTNQANISTSRIILKTHCERCMRFSVQAQWSKCLSCILFVLHHNKIYQSSLEGCGGFQAEHTFLNVTSTLIFLSKHLRGKSPFVPALGTFSPGSPSAQLSSSIMQLGRGSMLGPTSCYLQSHLWCVQECSFVIKISSSPFLLSQHACGFVRSFTQSSYGGSTNSKTQNCCCSLHSIRFFWI